MVKMRVTFFSHMMETSTKTSTKDKTTKMSVESRLALVGCGLLLKLQTAPQQDAYDGHHEARLHVRIKLPRIMQKYRS